MLSSVKSWEEGGERASEGELGREECRKVEQALFAQGTLHGPAEWRDGN